MAVPSSHSAGLLGPQGSHVRLGPMLSGSTASQSVPSQRNARPIQGQIGAIFFAATPAPAREGHVCSRRKRGGKRSAGQAHGVSVLERKGGTLAPAPLQAHTCYFADHAQITRVHLKQAHERAPIRACEQKACGR